MTAFDKAFRRMAGVIFRPTPKEEVWEWGDREVKIPEIVGSLNPGQLDTGRLRFWRLVWQLYKRPKTRFVTIQASARIGKTFFALICVLHKIATWPGPIGWLDATRFTARRFCRSEFQPHVMECEPVRRLAAIGDRTRWTLSEMFFEGSKLNMLGAGSPTDTTGFQAELIVINESNKCKHDIKAEANIHDIMIGRSKQFWRTRKIIEVSTPTDNYGRITVRHREGSQHHVYFPCPHCEKLQRITFSPEEKEVPWNDETEFDKDGYAQGEPVTSLEKTMSVSFNHCRLPHDESQFDLEKVERESVYLCGYCGETTPAHKLNWMMRRCTVRAHNLKAPEDHISFHAWTGMSPFEHIGGVAKKFLLARGNIAKMHSLYNDEFGLPFVRHATEIKETDLDLIVKMSPDYALRTLPREPIILTMTCDVQADCFWWTIRAHGIISEMEGVPIWSALVDYGSAVDWAQIEEYAGIKAKSDGTYHEFRFGDTTYRVSAGLIDSGFEAMQNKKVYDFCEKNQHVFSPSKGGGWMQLRGQTIRQTPVYDDRLELISYEDATMKQALFYNCIKERKEQWYLPRDICRTYRAQLTSEHTEEQKQTDGSMKLVWKVTGQDGNHLADCEKLQLVLGMMIEPRLVERREELMEARAKAA